MNTLPKIFRIWLILLLLLLIAKVYAALPKQFPTASTAYPETDTKSEKQSSKLNNYFLHQPYGPNTYAFGYELDDAQTGNVQFRDERRFLNGSIEGNFGYKRPDGLIQVTRYKADESGGYLAQSQSYKPGDTEVREPIWPTQLPELFRHMHKKKPATNITWDAHRHLNVSVDEVEHEVNEEVKAETGLDLFNINVTQDVLQPGVLDIVNGKTPLIKQPNGSLAFEMLQHVIPNSLPIVPFALPAEDILQTKDPETEHKRTELHKYNTGKSNNDEKSPQVASAAAASSTLPPPSPLVNSSSEATNWYQQIIQANRREFLKHLPNLN